MAYQLGQGKGGSTTYWTACPTIQRMSLLLVLWWWWCVLISAWGWDGLGLSVQGELFPRGRQVELAVLLGHLNGLAHYPLHLIIISHLKHSGTSDRTLSDQAFCVFVSLW